MVQLNFNAKEVKPMGDFEPLPEGDYRVIIEQSLERDNKAKTSKYLAITLQVLDGQYKGRKIFTNLNLWHPNSQVVDMAQAELSSICRAVDVLTPQDTAELHDRPMIVSLKVKERDDNGQKQNVVARYKKDGPTSNATDNNDAPWAK